MVHNGIEYGDIQLICEAYSILKNLLGMSNEDLHAVFTEWNKGHLVNCTQYIIVDNTVDLLQVTWTLT